MKYKTIELRLFNECSEELQKKIIQNYYDINLDFSLTDYNDSYAIDLINQGFNNPQIYYDLSYSQGSGACFDSKDFNFDILLKDYKLAHKNWIIDILNNYCDVYIKTINHYYEHELTRSFEIDFNDSGNHPKINELIEDIRNHIEHLRYLACKKLYHDLMNEYEYLTSDEGIKETLIANEYYFNKQGRIETLEDVA